MAELKSYSNHLKQDSSLKKIKEQFKALKNDPPAYIKILQQAEQDLKPSLQATYQRAQELKAEFDELVVVGIGGSHLGAESFLKALCFPRNVVFMENPDPMGLGRRLSALKDLSKTHFVFVSKSGFTYETLAIANWVLDHLNSKELSWSKHCTVITENNPQSDLQRWAKQFDITSLEAPCDLSGRYSVLSPAGLLPIYFALDIEELAPTKCGLEAFSKDYDEVIEYTSILWSVIAQGYQTLNFWNYSDQMQSFGKWWRQLWSESLGHKLPGPIKTSPTCVLCRGASDQHSYLQQVIDQKEGRLNIVLTIKDYAKDCEQQQKIATDHFKSSWNLEDKNMLEVYQRESLGLIKTFQDLDIPYLHLEFKEVSFSSLCYFVIQQQLAVSMLGHALGINPYTQPAVEEMKLRIKQLSAETV